MQEQAAKLADAVSIFKLGDAAHPAQRRPALPARGPARKLLA
jgi:methyl-accepting chemotaxis protein